MANTCWCCKKDTMEPHDFEDGQKGEMCTECGATALPTRTLAAAQDTTTGHKARRRAGLDR